MRKICEVEGCERNVNARGLCRAHYHKLRLSEAPACTFDKCESGQYAKGLCASHYQRALKMDGDPTLLRDAKMTECKEEDCTKKNFGRGLCRKHYMNYWRDEKWKDEPKELTVVSYQSAHNALHRLHGSARNYECAICQGEGEHWALVNKDRGWKDQNGSYGLPEDYAPMCATCHRRFDLGTLGALVKIERTLKPLDAPAKSRYERVDPRVAGVLIVAGYTVKEAAALMDTSFSGISKAFKRITGFSVSEYRAWVKAGNE